jgi:hypothetical protein
MDRGFAGRRRLSVFGACGCAVLLACIDVALALGAVTPSATSPALSFAGPRNYATGLTPESVAIGDLNGDRRPDLATANVTWGTVSVFLNRGGGRLRRTPDSATDASPASIAIGDLNGDGKPDLATANGGAGTVSVLLNNGGGSFQAKLDYPIGGEPNSLAIGDLNGDGKPDLATANQLGSNVSVLANRGDGTFEARRNYATERSPFAVAIGDLNGDGKQDLVTAGGVSVLLNRGDGRFRPRRNYQTKQWAWSVAVGDLNRDGKLDLATTDGLFHLGVLLNTTGLCTVPNVRGKPLPAATRSIARASCRVGKIRLAYSKFVTKGRVISERPKSGTVLPSGGMVSLVVSRGRKR